MEERNIKLSLEKAREFYSKGGELKDLALSAFTEDEILLQQLPKTWEEFCINNPICSGSQFYVDDQSKIENCELGDERDAECDRNLLPSKKSSRTTSCINATTSVERLLQTRMDS